MFFDGKWIKLKIASLNALYKIAYLIIKMFFKKEAQVSYLKKYERYKLYRYYIKRIPDYTKILRSLKLKQKRKEKIRVGFLVIYDSVFSARSLYEEMLLSDVFDPFIVIIPDIARSQEHMLKVFNKSYQNLSEKYQKVQKGYNASNDTFLDFSSKMDMAYFDNPYDCMVHDVFKVDYLKNKNILPFHINYGYMLTKYSRTVFATAEYSYFWKIFVECEI